MSLKFAILGLLTTFGDMSGYDLKQRFSESVSYIWEADLSQIYRALDRLETDQLVDSTPDPDSNRGRKAYHITDTGTEALLEWVQSDYEIPPVRDPALLRIFFSRDIPPERVREQIVDYRRQFEEIERQYHGLEEMLTRLIEQGWQAAFFQKLTLNLGHRYVQMTIDWCNYALQELDQQFSENHTTSESDQQE